MRVWERFARRQAEITGLMPVARLRRRLADLEPALEENARLEAVLSEQVSDLEQRVGELAHMRAHARDES
jgi:hypothetical protein